MISRLANSFAATAIRMHVLLVMGICAASATSKPAPKQTEANGALRILKAECFSCHGEEKKKGGLLLTSRESVLKGGDDGLAVIVGSPERSKLISALGAGADPHMPPKKQLPDDQIKVLRNWIKSGLAWDSSVLANDETELKPVQLEVLPPGFQPASALALNPDGTRLAVARGTIVLMHALSATNVVELARVDLGPGVVRSLAWSKDGRWLAAGGFRKTLALDATSLLVTKVWTNGLVGQITALKFATNGLLAMGDSVMGRGGWIRLVDLEALKTVASWRAHSDAVFDIDFSRDGRRLVTAGGDRLIKVWDASTRKEMASLEGHTAQVLAAAFNTNATQVVSGGADNQLKVWDIATREKIVSLGNHTAAITSVAWPGDGKAVVAATDAGGVLSYSNLKAHTGEQSSATADERLIGTATDSVFAVAATSDAQVVCAASHDGFVHVWNSDGKLLARLAPPAQAESVVTANSKVPAPRSPAALAIPRFAPTPKSSNSTPAPKSAVTSLKAEPAEVRLTADSPRQQLLITATLVDGFEMDVTDAAKFSAGRRSPFVVADGGSVTVLATGTGKITARFGGRTLEIPVAVTEAPKDSARRMEEDIAGVPVVPETSARSSSALLSKPLIPPASSFVRDVLPAMARAGCTAGACHAKADGQNGFKLSVFSYDPKHDYAEIVKDARGRRVFTEAPDSSLIIQKPLTDVPHEGGQRFARGSETHQLLVRWLREGVKFSATNEPVLARIEIFPKERRYKKGAAQRVSVRAHYSGGSSRDVTHLASFDSNDKEIAKVDENGRVTIGTLTGQGVVVARYMGFVTDSQILVPAEKLLPAADYAALPKNNFIDELAYAQFQRLGLFPSGLCTDAEFLRRASLDTVGLLPTPEEVTDFLKSGNRREVISRLLERPGFGDYWANKWADLVRPNPDRVGVKSIFTLDRWLRQSFRQNKPYDQFVREILLAEGTNHRDGPSVIYRDRREPSDLTTMFSQLFLGTRFECAKCHHHPNEKWSQDDFYQFAAFFGPLKQKGAGVSPPISAGMESFFFAPGGSVKHPITGAVMTPRAPDETATTLRGDTDPRVALADWLTDPRNPFFARAAVNRIWANYFGRGLVEPVDDFRISNPCVNSALLDALAKEFTDHGYDLKHLIRTIVESRLYQLSSTPNESNLADTRNFSRSYRRRLPAEVLLDAVSEATGVEDTFVATAPGTRAMQTWSYKIDSQFMDAFSRPNPSSDPPCERERGLSVVQSLHLMNSKNLHGKLSDSQGRVRKLADSTRTPEEIVRELYLATLSRPPADQELKVATSPFATPGAVRQTATEDVLWALLNSPEFVLNH
ncbi:MAG: DUF1553 domain-containing protein [Pedosphaera sp.]|nr:DUF1553 domain-containing protein [Pedosphaera sp.]